MLRNSLIKFITAVLFFVSMVAFYVNPAFKFVLYIMICLAIVRFFVTMILEPDSIWEIIKKFIYVLIVILLGCYIAFNNMILLWIVNIVIVIDTIIETRRFTKVIKNK